MGSISRIVASAITAGLVGCAVPGVRDAAPAEWVPWTAAAKAADGPRLSQLVVEGAHGDASRWAAKWSTPPASLPWTDATLELVVKYQQNPLRAARALALVHVAMHDALALAAREGVPPAARAIAIHRAAGLVLAHLYPGETAGRLEGHGIAAAVAVALARDTRDDDFTRALDCGTGAGRAAVTRALADGAGRIWPVRLRPAPEPGRWIAAPPLNIYDPAEAYAGEWRTWVLADASEIQPPPPIVYGSPAYWQEVDEVAAVSRALTPEQRRIAEDWNLDQGSVTPPGVWNRRARALALAQGLDEATTVRLFASLNAAMTDALIACWKAKYTWWTLRPVNAIRARSDAAYLPHLNTPAFPSYVSGHASASGAAAEVLAHFFPAERARVMAEAEQAAESRLYGGIHFRSDNVEGLKLGRAVGAKAIAALQRRTEASTR